MPVVKPVFTATASAPVATGGTITTTINPVTSRFFATITADMIGPTETTILAASFTDDDDGPVTSLPPIVPANNYFNVYINGVLQQNSLSTLTTASLVLDTTDLLIGTPVSLEIASFAAAASDLTTPPTISAPDITINT
ncbi:DUF4183 domain-containing protein [Paenibacillus fonticola]|uniref:DUF4183 domain-containing protein n=1 Tax=Paenibacillus fonticola TaxID=379896 RepID=UPI000372ED4E|nr:DUF4183 domain-containing protein [Paenibacillus fonticola]